MNGFGTRDAERFRQMMRLVSKLLRRSVTAPEGAETRLGSDDEKELIEHMKWAELLLYPERGVSSIHDPHTTAQLPLGKVR